MRGWRGFDLERKRLEQIVSGINAVIDIVSGAVKTRFPTVRAEEHVLRLVQIQAP